MKILHVSTKDFHGGAARAAYRIHRAQVHAGLDSRMLVRDTETGDDRVTAIAELSRMTWLKREFLRRWYKKQLQDWHPVNPGSHTFGWCSAGLVETLNSCDADILNLHWISDILSVSDIGRLKKPIVWTLHDMWPMCGGEHYAPDDPEARYRQGYREDNRPLGESGPDLNRRAWEIKCRAWKLQRFSFACPSNWLAGCVRKSRLFPGVDVAVIPNPLDTRHLWRPVSREAARVLLDLPIAKKLIIFGADGGMTDSRKGGDLLRQAITKVVEKMGGEVELIIFGQSRDACQDNWPCPVHWLGVVRDDRLLVQAYSAADVMVMPSVQDNLPNTAIEAQSCGTPVVAFDVGGVPDIVVHRKTGWLARKDDVEDLAAGICWVLSQAAPGGSLAIEARRYSVASFSEPVIASKYRELYRRILGK